MSGPGVTPEELEAIRTSAPERYEALTRRALDQQLAAAAERRGDPLYASEFDPLVPTAYEEQARAEREAARLAGDPERRYTGRAARRSAPTPSYFAVTEGVVVGVREAGASGDGATDGEEAGAGAVCTTLFHSAVTPAVAPKRIRPPTTATTI